MCNITRNCVAFVNQVSKFNLLHIPFVTVALAAVRCRLLLMFVGIQVYLVIVLNAVKQILWQTVKLEDPHEMPLKEAFLQDLHCLLR